MGRFFIGKKALGTSTVKKGTLKLLAKKGGKATVPVDTSAIQLANRKKRGAVKLLPSGKGKKGAKPNATVNVKPIRLGGQKKKTIPKIVDPRKVKLKPGKGSVKLKASTQEKYQIQGKGKTVSQEEAKKIVRKYFNENEVGVEFVHNITTRDGQQALGKYKNKMITFAKNPTKTTPEHEVFHAYFDLALGKNKKKAVLNGIKKEKGFKTNLEAEEFLADSFADFAIGRRNIHGVSERVKKVIGDLWHHFKKVFGKENKIEGMFRDLEAVGKGKKSLKLGKDSGEMEKYFVNEDGKMLQDLSVGTDNLATIIQNEYKNSKLQKSITEYHKKISEKIKTTPAYENKYSAKIKGVRKNYSPIDIYESDIGYKNINSFLRRKKYNSKEISKASIINIINDLDNSFLVSPENMRLYRGLQVGKTGDMIVNKIKNGKLKTGDMIEDFDSAYTSTSIAPSSANEFDGDVFYIIDIQKGDKILPIRGSNLADAEKEILLPKNLKPKVKDIKKMDLNGFGVDKYLIHIEL